MAVTTYIKWWIPSLILYCGCSVYMYDINSEVCLSTPFNFASRKACKFTLKDAKDWFESEKAKMEYKHWIRPQHLSTEKPVDITQDLTARRKPVSYERRPTDKPTMEYKPWIRPQHLSTEEPVGVTEDLISTRKPVSYERRPNIASNPVKINYTELAKQILAQQPLQQQNLNPEDNRAGVTVGSFIGGLILGVVITVLVQIVYKYIRNGKPNAEKSNAQRLQFLTTILMKLKEILNKTFPRGKFQMSEGFICDTNRKENGEECYMKSDVSALKMSEEGVI